MLTTHLVGARQDGVQLTWDVFGLGADDCAQKAQDGIPEVLGICMYLKSIVNIRCETYGIRFRCNIDLL
jgi:hypothetical protein